MKELRSSEKKFLTHRPTVLVTQTLIHEGENGICLGKRNEKERQAMVKHPLVCAMPGPMRAAGSGFCKISLINHFVAKEKSVLFFWDAQVLVY